MRTKPLIWGAALAVALILAGSIVWRANRDDSLERVREQGVMRVGYAIDPPYAMVGPDGRVTGASPETARAIAERLGVKNIEWVQAPLEALIPDLRNGRLDMLATGLRVTSARAQIVLFSDPTLCVRPGVLVRRGNPAGVAPFEALTAQAGYTIAVVAGSLEEQRLRTRGWDSEDGLLIAPDAQVARAVLAQGLVDGLALSEPALRWIADSSTGKYEILSDANAPMTDYAAFAFRKDAAALRDAWNEAQASFLGGDAHLELLSPFGLQPADVAVGVHTPEVLQR